MSEITAESFLSKINSPPKNGKGHKGLLAGGSCRGICPRYKAKSISRSCSKYGSGFRYCGYCSLFLKWNENYFCPCCGKKLRTRSRSKNNSTNGDKS